MTEGARRQCRLALTRKNTETNDELQLALFSSNDWSEESRQVKAMANSDTQPPDPGIANFRNELRSRHEDRLTNAKDQGQLTGSTNSPPIPQEQPYPFEQDLHSRYEGDLGELQELAQPLLEAFHAAHSSVQWRLQRTDEQWNAHEADRLNDLTENTKRHQEQARARHTSRLVAVDDEIDSQIQSSYNRAKEQLQEIQSQVGRKYLEVSLRSRLVYVSFLALIGIAEFPLNLKVFENFRDGVTSTMLMALSLVLAIPLASHFSGLSLK